MATPPLTPDEWSASVKLVKNLIAAEADRAKAAALANLLLGVLDADPDRMAETWLALAQTLRAVTHTAPNRSIAIAVISGLAMELRDAPAGPLQ